MLVSVLYFGGITYLLEMMYRVSELVVQKIWRLERKRQNGAYVVC